MGTKRQSDRERLIEYALKATTEQLEEALEIFRTHLRHRKPTAERTSKPRAVKATGGGKKGLPAASTDKEDEEGKAFGAGGN